MSKNYLFAGGFSASLAGAALASASAGRAAFELSSAVFAIISAGVSGLLDNTDTFPVIAGIDSKSAVSINVDAAAIVTFESTVAVPRGANAELDTLLVNSAPASVLPGCSKTAATSTIHERKNNPYKKITIASSYN